MIKDKEKEINDSSEKKQSNDSNAKKEDGSSKKGFFLFVKIVLFLFNIIITYIIFIGKDKWIRYIPNITHNTPLPGHERSKPHRRRSEDHVGLREQRRSNDRPNNHNNNNSSEVEPNNLPPRNSSPRRRASVPPPTREYPRRFSQPNDNSGQIGHHISGGSHFRGGRRGGRGNVLFCCYVI